MVEQRSRKLLRLGSLLCVILMLCLATPGLTLPGDDDESDLVGTWRVTVFPGPPDQRFFSLMMFNKGGTLTERIANLPAGVTPSIGVWKRTSSHRLFAATMEGFLDTDSNGVFDQRYRVRLTIQLVNDDKLTASGTVDFLTLDGTTELAGPFPNNVFEGTRMKVMPE